jgi:peptidoglycan/LPS O-acetylase OafA/YrhL
MGDGRRDRQSTRREPTPVTLDQVFSGRNNSLNLLRLVLASIVLFDHAQALGSFGSDSIFGKTTPGQLAVYGFFGISGYLIAASATRHGFVRFLWQRVLRILPAFWVCLVITACFFGVIGWYRNNPHCGITCYIRAPLGPLD